MKAYYLFCLTQSTVLPEQLGTDTRLFLHQYAGISALLEAVQQEDFRGEDFAAQQQNPEWLIPRIQRHERCIEAMMQQSSVLPARFATLFSSLDALETYIAEHALSLNKALQKLQGHAEWSVKGWLAREAAIQSRVQAQLAQTTLPDSPGQRYVEERRAYLAEEKKLNTWVSAVCQSVLEELQHHAQEFTQRALFKNDNADTLVSNWAFLLSEQQQEFFAAALRKLNQQYAAQGLRFEQTGPWPPYSFSPSL